MKTQAKSATNLSAAKFSRWLAQSDRHNRIVMNIGYQIDNRLRNSRCETFTENVKLRADAPTFYYPDVIIVCDETPESSYYRQKPVLLVEVLLPSTERVDRTEKLTVYKNIPTLREYLTVSQDKISVEVYRRLENGDWQAEIDDELIRKLSSIRLI